MALEPARLYADSAAAYGPFGAVGGHGHTTAFKDISIVGPEAVEKGSIHG